MSHTPQEILSRLFVVEDKLSLALANADKEELQDNLVHFHSVEGEILELAREGSVLQESWTPIVSAIQRIKLVADSFARQEIKLSQRIRETAKGVEDLLQKRGHGALKVSSPPNRSPQSFNTFHQDSDANDQSLNAVVMRRWMLEHIDHPFPTTHDKEAIAEETNCGGTGSKGQLRAEQATLWFINSRRRSGWTQWARRFANSDKARLRDIVAAIRNREEFALGVGFEDPLEPVVEANDFKDRSLTKKELAHACRTEFAKVTEWIEQGSKEKVGDWMDKVVAEARETLKRTKRERRAARKLVDERVRGRAPAAATTQDGTDSSEDESPREQPFHQLQLNRRPIRQLPQQRHASGASSSSSGLSSVVSGGLERHSGTSSSAATSLDSFYESGALMGQPAMHMKVTCPDEHFQQIQVTDHRPSIEASYVALHSTFTSSGLQQYQRGDVAQDFKTEPMAFVPPHSPSLAGSAGLNQGQLQFYGMCQPPIEQHPFFMPAVAAAAALGNNWGMPVSTLAMDSEMAEQLEEPVDYGGWLAWSGQMAGA